MNLITDLGAEIAFAVLVEKTHHEKIKSKDILPLIGRLNEALKQISENEDLAEQILIDSKSAQYAAH